ncbi:MAG: hypothetical protein WC824_08090 [Bacteroidota bacterium]|jgi:hypothetical protein
MKEIPTITYKYRGMIERGIGNCNTRPGYAWHEGYSEDGENGRGLMGWMTKEECRTDAKSRGSKAEFVR